MQSQFIHFKNRQEIHDLTLKYQLLQQLKYYGLQPKEWTFSSLEFSEDGGSGTARLEFREDQNVGLQGQLTRSPSKGLKLLHRWMWKDLEWEL